MIAVVVVAVPLAWGTNRHLSFLKLAMAHEARIVGVSAVFATTTNGDRIHVWFDSKNVEISYEQVKRDDWHRAMAAKYRSAAHRPWLPVPPDPPEPE